MPDVSVSYASLGKSFTMLEMATDHGLEERFCKDYICCGLHLSDLHELLQHFEECHVHMESDGEDVLPFAFDDDDDIYISALDLVLHPTTIPFRFDKPVLLEDQMDIDDGPTAAPISTIDRYSPFPSPTLNNDRPYICKIANCGKAYKNLGGLKYHMKHGHCEDTGDPEMNSIIQKPYVCKIDHCGKRYKNLNGLKYHMEHSHGASPVL